MLQAADTTREEMLASLRAFLDDAKAAAVENPDTGRMLHRDTADDYRAWAEKRVAQGVPTPGLSDLTLEFRAWSTALAAAGKRCRGVKASRHDRASVKRTVKRFIRQCDENKKPGYHRADFIAWQREHPDEAPFSAVRRVYHRWQRALADAGVETYSGGVVSPGPELERLVARVAGGQHQTMRDWEALRQRRYPNAPSSSAIAKAYGSSTDDGQFHQSWDRAMEAAGLMSPKPSSNGNKRLS